MSHITLQQQASRYRKSKKLTGGVVVFFNGQVAGWMNELRDPNRWEPGCIALDAHGHAFKAIGGNAYDGALAWQSLDNPQHCFPQGALL